MDFFGLKKRRIVHLACGRQHVDRGFHAAYNHFKHYCEFCERHFYDSESGVGVSEVDGYG